MFFLSDLNTLRVRYDACFFCALAVRIGRGWKRKNEQRNLVAYCDEECQKIHWMRHRPNCVEDYWKANDIKICVSTLVAYDHAALMDQEDKYHHNIYYGVGCFAFGQ